MASTMRWRYDDTRPVVAAVQKTTIIEIGDLLWQDVDNAKPASMFSSGLANPLSELFAKVFLGVAMSQSRLEDDKPIRVATFGVFLFDCPRNTFELGNLIRVDTFDGGKKQKLCNQRVAEALYSNAIARVAKRVSSPATEVLIAIRSTVMKDWPYPG